MTLNSNKGNGIWYRLLVQREINAFRGNDGWEHEGRGRDYLGGFIYLSNPSFDDEK